MLKRARDPGPATAVRPPARHVPLLQLDSPAIREVEPGDDVDEGRLPGAVGTDQAHDLVPAELERDVLKRLHALERSRDAGGPERSGPPIVMRWDGEVAQLDLRDDLRCDGPDDLRLVVVDPDHAVRTTRHRVKVPGERDEPRRGRDLRNFSICAASARPCVDFARLIAMTTPSIAAGPVM